jgi:hypothetical protein
MLRFIFQQSYDTGETPADWKNALVAAIYKKGTKSDPANYRPISLTCLCCKVMEHVVLSHLAKHLAEHDILFDKQHGFRSKYSCETQLISAIHEWGTELNARGQVDVVLLDFSKAFDKVSHKHLLHKLEYYGIKGKTLGWIEAFLSERKQSVSVNGDHSSPAAVTSGVPQGSVLGPMLFLLYINDIHEQLHSEIRLFADDSIVYREINSPDDHRLLQEDLDRLAKWSDDWLMEFNVTKCYLLSITKKTKLASKFTYRMNNEEISKVPSSKYLGATISDNLSWNTHVDNITSKASKTLGLIRRTLGSCSQEVKTKAYQTLVRPSLEYASCAWNPHQSRNIDKLEGVQRAAARFVCKDYRRTTSVTGLLTILNWDSLATRRLLATTTMMFKIHSGAVAISLPPEVQLNHKATRHHHAVTYTQLPISINCYNYSFYPRVIRLWNKLPLAAVSAQTTEGFQTLAMPALRMMQPPPSLRFL